MESNRVKFNKFFHSMLKQGIYFGPSAFEAGFVSAAHSEKDIKETIEASHKAFESLND
jgi:glutamate-1-semialdehyde 2,1-aminomutase